MSTYAQSKRTSTRPPASSNEASKKNPESQTQRGVRLLNSSSIQELRNSSADRSSAVFINSTNQAAAVNMNGSSFIREKSFIPLQQQVILHPQQQQLVRNRSISTIPINNNQMNSSMNASNFSPNRAGPPQSQQQIITVRTPSNPRRISASSYTPYNEENQEESPNSQSLYIMSNQQQQNQLTPNKTWKINPPGGNPQQHANPQSTHYQEDYQQDLSNYHQHQQQAQQRQQLHQGMVRSNSFAGQPQQQLPHQMVFIANHPVGNNQQLQASQVTLQSPVQRTVSLHPPPYQQQQQQQQVYLQPQQVSYQPSATTQQSAITVLSDLTKASAVQRSTQKGAIASYTARSHFPPYTPPFSGFNNPPSVEKKTLNSSRDEHHPLQQPTSFYTHSRGDGSQQFFGRLSTYNSSGKKLSKYQEARLNNVLTRSQDDVREVLETALEDESIKLKQEIEFLQNKLRLKDQEVNVFSNYVSELRQQEVATAIANNNPYIVNNTLANSNGSPLHPSLPNSPPPPVSQASYRGGGYEDRSLHQFERRSPSARASSSQLTATEETVALTKELVSIKLQNKQQQAFILSLERQYSGLKAQLEDRDELVVKQQEELNHVLEMSLESSRRQTLDEAAANEKIHTLEEENQLYILKIQSLERNFLHIEKEYRMLKERQSNTYQRYD